MMRVWEQSRVQWWGSAVCLLAACLLGVWSVAKLAVWATGGPVLAGQQEGEGASVPVTPLLDELMSGYKERAELLKKEGHFKPEAGPPPKPKQCLGIVGDRAFIDGKWVKVGDKVGSAAEVLAIEPTFVKLRWCEEEITLAPIKAAGGNGGAEHGRGGRPRPPGPRPAMGPQLPRPTKRPKQAAASKPAEDPFGWLGVTLTPEQRATLLEEWNSMGDQEKAEAKEEWKKMSQEEKERAVESLSRDRGPGRGRSGRR